MCPDPSPPLGNGQTEGTGGVLLLPWTSPEPSQTFGSPPRSGAGTSIAFGATARSSQWPARRTGRRPSSHGCRGHTEAAVSTSLGTAVFSFDPTLSDETRDDQGMEFPVA